MRDVIYTNSNRDSVTSVYTDTAFHISTLL